VTYSFGHSFFSYPIAASESVVHVRSTPRRPKRLAIAGTA